MIISNKRQNGFTLIEIVIVVGVLAITLPATFMIVFNLLRMNLQLKQLQRIKEVGDYASNTMISTVRANAFRVDDTCANDDSTAITATLSNTSKVFFRDRLDQCFGYYVLTDVNEVTTLASVSAQLPPADNYSTPLIVDDETDDFPVTVISPEFTSLNDRLVKIKFKVRSNATTSYLKPQELGYQFYIYLRN